MNSGMPVGSWDFCDTRLTMDICYRSTRELTLFTRSFLPDPEAIRPFDRSGEKPLLMRLPDLSGETLAEIIRKLDDPGRTAVIARTRVQAEKICDSLKSVFPEIRLLTADDREPASDLSVVPSWLCQGLEFDTVLAAEPSSYAGPEERGILYTVCARAQQRVLILDTTGTYIPDMDPSLYEIRE
jgi:DNA helicase-2/ATP-dependent DNA helicase PcrA